jgi:osmotically-inducible protein OsmY
MQRMAEQRERSPYYEPPDAGLGGEGAPFDLSVLAPTTDAEIARGVHEALVLEPDVDADNYAIDVENGEVRLVGKIRSAEERRRAIVAASRVHGVRRVVDQLAE